MINFSKLRPFRNLMDRDSIKLYRDNPCQFFEEQFVIPWDSINRIQNTPANSSPVKLFPFQKEILTEALSRNSKGDFIYDTAYISMAKKNSKSTLGTMIFLYKFFFGDPDPELVFVANSKDQASWIAYAAFKEACELNPQIARITTCSYKDTRIIGTYARAFAVPYTDAANHGTVRLAGVEFDESWSYSDFRVYAALKKNLARNDYMAVTTSYAGVNKKTALYALYLRGKKDKPPNMYYKCYEAESEKEEHWLQANPAPWNTLEALKNERYNNPTLTENDFKRFHLNMWVDPSSTDKLQKFFTIDQIIAVTNQDLCEAEFGKSDYDYVCAVDIGLVRDNTAVAVLHREDKTIKLDVLAVWAGSTSNPPNLSEVEDYLKSLYLKFNCTFVFDRTQAGQMMQNLKRDYPSCSIFEVNFQSSNAQMAQLLYHIVR